MVEMSLRFDHSRGSHAPRAQRPRARTRRIKHSPRDIGPNSLDLSPSQHDKLKFWVKLTNSKTFVVISETRYYKYGQNSIRKRQDSDSPSLSHTHCLSCFNFYLFIFINPLAISPIPNSHLPPPSPRNLTTFSRENLYFLGLGFNFLQNFKNNSLFTFYRI